MTIATGLKALASDVAAIRTLASSAQAGASAAAANAATALSNSVAAQLLANEAMAGAKGIATSVFTQETPSETWVVVHNMNCFPIVVVVGNSGTVTEGDISYDSANQITLTFSAALTGTAYLN